MGIIGIVNEINTNSDYEGAMRIKELQSGDSSESMSYDRDEESMGSFINSFFCGSFWSKLKISGRNKENLFLSFYSTSESKLQIKINEKSNRTVDIVFILDNGSPTSVFFNVKCLNDAWVWFYFYVDFENFENSFLSLNEEKYSPYDIQGEAKSLEADTIESCVMFEESSFLSDSMFARIWIDFDTNIDSEEFFHIRRRFVKKSSWILMPLNLGAKGEMPIGKVPIMYSRFSEDASDSASGGEFDYDSDKIEFINEFDLLGAVEV